MKLGRSVALGFVLPSETIVTLIVNIGLLGTVLIILVLAILVILIIIRNRKDEKELTQQLNEDYRKPKLSESDVEIEDRRSI